MFFEKRIRKDLKNIIFSWEGIFLNSKDPVKDVMNKIRRGTKFPWTKHELLLAI